MLTCNFASSIHRASAASMALFACLTAGACSTPETVPAPQSVENAALGLRLLLPADPWTVVSEEPQRWVLSDGDGGTMIVHLGPESEQTPNIIEAVRGHLAEFSAMENGESFGSQQLQAPIGLVYTARGRYPGSQDPATTVGEMASYTVHAGGDRFLILSYTYPGEGDPNQRGQNLLALLTSLELLTGEEPTGPTAGDQATDS